MLATISLAVTIEVSKHGMLAGAKVSIDAVVIKVDARHRNAMIRYAPLETAPAGVRVVRIGDRVALKIMHAGEKFTAVADTSRTPWVLSNIVRKTN